MVNRFCDDTEVSDQSKKVKTRPPHWFLQVQYFNTAQQQIVNYFMMLCYLTQ